MMRKVAAKKAMKRSMMKMKMSAKLVEVGADEDGAQVADEDAEAHELAPATKMMRKMAAKKAMKRSMMKMKMAAKLVEVGAGEDGAQVADEDAALLDTSD